MNFYISDTHFGHENILRFDNRPFKDVNEMETVMIENWNNSISENDFVYILGDFCWSGKQEIWQGLLRRLNGKKYLIRGNHDVNLSNETLKLLIGCSDYLEINDNDRNVFLSHYPMPFYKSSWNFRNFMLYGHVHTTREYDMMEMLTEHLVKTADESNTHNRGMLYNVGCMLDYMGYTPRTLDEICANA